MRSVPIKGFGKYRIYEDGRIWCSRRGRFKTRSFNPVHKYEQVALYRDGKRYHFRLHRILYESFKGEIPSGIYVNHKDGNKINNHISNLELVTPQENTQHAVRTGLINPKKGSSAGTSKLKEQDILSIFDLSKQGVTQSTLAKRLNVDQSTISLILSNKTWKHLCAL